LPFVPRRHLLPYLQKSNALLIPYDMQFEFNKASFPMKVMEYFYAGKPIVATSLPSLKPYKEFINLADSSKEFDLAIKKSIREKWTVAKKHAARQIAKKQTWAQKITAVDEYLTKVLGSI
jgi:teichuronic acid biosynthesis glycosyltransferase TuaH